MQDSNPYRDPKQKRVLIIGGGAAGFFTAIKIVEEDPSIAVTILEQGKDVLGKVKISGGGRCNLAHAEFIPRELSKNYPRGQRELLGPFNSFSSGDTMAWFEERGVAVKIEDDGRIFPISNSSQSVVDCFLNACKKYGVKIMTTRKVLNVYPPEESNQCWKAICGNREQYFADHLVIATGSSKFMWEQISHLGHTIVPPVPSLFTFNIKDPRIKDLMGLSVPNAEVQIKALKAKNHGPLLITHWGMSGPVILKASSKSCDILIGNDDEFGVLANDYDKGMQVARELSSEVSIVIYNKVKSCFRNTQISRRESLLKPAHGFAVTMITILAAYERTAEAACSEFYMERNWMVVQECFPVILRPLTIFMSLCSSLADFSVQESPRDFVSTTKDNRDRGVFFAWSVSLQSFLYRRENRNLIASWPRSFHEGYGSVHASFNLWTFP